MPEDYNNDNPISDMAETTTIEVEMDTWRALNALKSRPGESFDDVIWNLLNDESGDMGGMVAERETVETVETVTNPDRSESDDGGVQLPVILRERLEEYRQHCEEHDPARVEERVAAAQAIFEILSRDGGVSKRQAISELLPEYSVDGQKEETWWRKNGKDLLGEVAEWQSGRNEYVLED